MDFKKKYINILIIVGLIIGINKSISSYISLHNFRKTIDTNEEWRFYFVLIEFLSFSVMTLVLLLLIFRKYMKK